MWGVKREGRSASVAQGHEPTLANFRQRHPVSLLSMYQKSRRHGVVECCKGKQCSKLSEYHAGRAAPHLAVSPSLCIYTPSNWDPALVDPNPLLTAACITLFSPTLPHTSILLHALCSYTPSDWDPALADRSSDLPSARLVLEFVYGYQGERVYQPVAFIFCHFLVWWRLGRIGDQHTSSFDLPLAYDRIDCRSAVCGDWAAAFPINTPPFLCCAGASCCPHTTTPPTAVAVSYPFLSIYHASHGGG